MRTGYFALIIAALAVFGVSAVNAETTTTVVHNATYQNHSSHSYGNGAGSYGPSKNHYGAIASDYGPAKDNYNGQQHYTNGQKSGNNTQAYVSPSALATAVPY